MAQKLKDDVRLAIIKAAKEEFLEKGYKGASMRSIANKANMTVGNLYRYYKNKEDINLSIVAPTFRLIDNAIKSLNNSNVNMEPRVFNLKPNVEDVKANFDEFADNLVDIYFKNKTEFNILILHSRVSEEMINKFSEIISDMISQFFVLNNLSTEKDILCLAYANSLFSGIQTIFNNTKDDSSYLKVMIKTYLRSFLYMLDNDISKYAQ